MSDDRTETFTAKHLETREDSVKIEFNGTVTFIPRRYVERMSIENGRVTITIPYWVYFNRFGDGLAKGRR